MTVLCGVLSDVLCWSVVVVWVCVLGVVVGVMSVHVVFWVVFGYCVAF